MTETRTEAEIRAAEAAASAAAELAKLDLERKKAEFEEWKAASEQRRKDAQAVSETARLTNEASQLTNAEAQRSAAKDLVPDLSAVDRGSLTVPESSTMFGALLAGRALQDAAGKLIGAVKGSLANDFRVLVTTELDLASRDTTYVTMVKQLRALKDLVDDFMRPARGDALTSFAPPALAAAATLVPGLLSLFSARRTVSTSTSSLDDDLVLMAAAGALAGADTGAVVVADKARLLDPDGEVQRSWAALRTGCSELEEHIKGLERTDAPDAERITEGKALLKSCQVALTAMVAVPEGGTASPLTIASVQEALHSIRFEAVLVVKGGAASATQLVDDRPLFFKDPLSVVSSATIAFLLIDHRNGGKILKGGLVHGMAQVEGKIGKRLSVLEGSAR